MNTEDKLAYLTDKLASKEKALADCNGKKAGIKQLEKRLKSEISVLKEEIRSTELEVLGDFLNQSGIELADIREAVNSGLFDKTEAKIDSAGSASAEQDNTKNVSSVTRKGEENEVSDS